MKRMGWTLTDKELEVSYNACTERHTQLGPVVVGMADFVAIFNHYEPPAGIQLTEDRLQSTWMTPRIKDVDAIYYAKHDGQAELRGAKAVAAAEAEKSASDGT